MYLTSPAIAAATEHYKWYQIHGPRRAPALLVDPGLVCIVFPALRIRSAVNYSNSGVLAPPTDSQSAAATRISTVSYPAPSTTHLLAPLRFSLGSSPLSLFFGAAANISSLFVGFDSVCCIPSAWIDAVRASPCEVSPNRAVSPGLRSSRHGAP